MSQKMSKFSGALQLTDLDDFITPSQVRNCVLSDGFAINLGFNEFIVITGMYKASGD